MTAAALADTWTAVGRDLAALRVLRRALVGEPARPERVDGLRHVLPSPLSRYHCPACWNDLPVGAAPEYIACPSCGHGMFLVEINDPHACTACHAISDGPPARAWHRFVDREGHEHRPCRGSFAARPYLRAEVVRRADTVALRDATTVVVADLDTDPAALAPLLAPPPHTRAEHG